MHAHEQMIHHACCVIRRRIACERIRCGGRVRPTCCTMKPRVVVAYSNLWDVQMRVLHRYGIEPEYLDTSGDDEAYWRTLRDLWDDRRSFVLIEHDILPWPGAIEQLWECPCPWGGFSYHVGGAVGNSVYLGCTKFTTELMDRYPDAIRMINDGIPGGVAVQQGGDIKEWSGGRKWFGLDGQVYWMLVRLMGEGPPHRHGPPVIHLQNRLTPA